MDISFQNINGYVLPIDMFLSVTYHQLVIPLNVYFSSLIMP